MKKSMICLLVAMALPCAGVAKSADSFESIVASPAYKKVVAEHKRQGMSFGCEAIAEKLESQDYSSLGGVNSIFKLVVLQCSVDPRDSGDSIKQAGLAVIAQGEVVSFSVGYIGQAD